MRHRLGAPPRHGAPQPLLRDHSLQLLAPSRLYLCSRHPLKAWGALVTTHSFLIHPSVNPSTHPFSRAVAEPTVHQAPSGVGRGGSEFPQPCLGPGWQPPACDLEPMTLTFCASVSGSVMGPRLKRLGEVRTLHATVPACGAAHTGFSSAEPTPCP